MHLAGIFGVFQNLFFFLNQILTYSINVRRKRNNYYRWKINKVWYHIRQPSYKRHNIESSVLGNLYSAPRWSINKSIQFGFLETFIADDSPASHSLRQYTQNKMDFLHYHILKIVSCNQDIVQIITSHFECVKKNYDMI